jgi:prepilin-type N-terminal cleavage/methylation domain-containing protein
VRRPPIAGRRAHRQRGFTLIEVLAALAIASVIIMAVGALIFDVARHFDRGTRSVQEAERLMLAIERLAQDFNSARFVTWTGNNGAALAFTGEPAAADKPARIVMVANAGITTGPQGEEIVTLTVERAGEVRRLVRRRSPWAGPWMRPDRVSPQDPVVLIEGRFDIAFVFGRVTPGGGLSWSQSWIGETSLPRFARLRLLDPETGSDLLGEADFVLRADAPAGCGRPGAGTGCLASALADAAQ